MSNCRAVCVPGVEDFGLVPVEANASGKPVVAFSAGGVLETQQEGVTASLFVRPEVDDVIDAIRRVDAIDTPPQTLRSFAERFSQAAFRRGLLTAIAGVAPRQVAVPTRPAGAQAPRLTGSAGASRARA
jgi:glycosyltransferase involved in cell wall biosynthesis